MMASHSLLLRMSIVSEKKLQRKSKHTYYVQQRFSENNAVYEIMWKNVVALDKPQFTI
jgi:hypothetical protein